MVDAFSGIFLFLQLAGRITGGYAVIATEIHRAIRLVMRIAKLVQDTTMKTVDVVVSVLQIISDFLFLINRAIHAFDRGITPGLKYAEMTIRTLASLVRLAGNAAELEQ